MDSGSKNSVARKSAPADLCAEPLPMLAPNGGNREEARGDMAQGCESWRKPDADSESFQRFEASSK